MAPSGQRALRPIARCWRKAENACVFPKIRTFKAVGKTLVFLRASLAEALQDKDLSMPEMFSPEILTALFSVIIIDLVLAGDNAIVVGLAAAGLPRGQRKKVILIGIAAATGLRVVFALLTTQLLQIIGLLLAGGVLLLWVSWKFWRELESERQRRKFAARNPALTESDRDAPDSDAPPVQEKTMKQAIIQIVLADVSMSLDNVLAVAGAAMEHPGVLVFGLVLSVAMMGAAATAIAALLERYRWIAYVGLAIIAYVALKMIYDGASEVAAFAVS
jgi:YjbE family integral membrane protein